MKTFEYDSPETLEETFSLLGPDGEGATRPLAGGTDLLTLMKADIVSPDRLVNLKRLGELPSGIKETGDGVTLGALTTLTEIERSPLLRRRCPALTEAASLAATPQLRNMATIGGNLLQRPRCWYYRNSLFHCWLKGGDDCPACDGQNQYHALFGGGPCYAVHPSDLAPALLALDAEVILKSRNGERRVSLSEFFALPEEGRRTETTIREGELVTALRIPPHPEGTRSTYLKAMDRKVWAFALVGVAAAVRLEGKRIEEVRLVLNGVAPVPWRVREAEGELIGSEVGGELFTHVSETALKGARPLEHNAYKIPLLKTLIRRALETLTETEVPSG
ncbi:MAG: xanthine dehydrogenase family protein subunit M [Armatimonadetes bacterium]|nr:xanthine dehydrogenase family protein subunit M [Armatimonadota bacterium]